MKQILHSAASIVLFVFILHRPLLAQTGSEQQAPLQTIPGQTIPGQTIPGQTIPGQTIPGQTIPGQTIPGLSAPVEVFFDEYSIPHIYAQDWIDASRVLGYLHAGDRLWQMDMLRRQASGRLAEVIGPDGLSSDQLMRQLGIFQSCQEIWKSDEIPASMRAELEAYAEGVNHKMAQLGTEDLPPAFQMLGYQPQAWQAVDCLVFSKYMGWDQSGSMDDLWMGSLFEKLGLTALEELWPIDRPYEQPTIASQSSRPQDARRQNLSQLPPEHGSIQRRDFSPVDSLPLESHDEVLAGNEVFPRAETGSFLLPSSSVSPETFIAYRNLYNRLNGVGWLGRGSSFGSNNWAVSGSKTKSGKPIVCSDPHLGFTIPSIWYTAHLSVKGQNVAGVTFPGAPTVVIGHNDRIAWGLTNMQADAVDFYVETTDAQNPQRYLHRGQWKEMSRRVETIAVRGSEPREFIIESTVHGPILQREPATIAMCWTGLGPTTDSIAFWKISRAQNLDEFLTGLDYLQVPALNVVYGDVEGTIAMHCCGRLPLRTRGQGRIPMDGASGQNDWVGWIPREQLPLSINPSEQFVASANGRPHPVGYPHYLGWMWDPSYRTRRIKDLLREAGDLTIETMKPIQFDHFDQAASRFLPAMLDGLNKSREVANFNKLHVDAIELLSTWDYLATPESIAPAIWLRWLEKYRDCVWQDEWEVNELPQQTGSWGFTGDNRREPVLEVLEYLTLEMPESRWFDDLRTPQRETRDDLLVKSWLEAVASLQAELGKDPSNWSWKHVNLLKIESLSGDPRLNIEGGPVYGDMFTLNPGGHGGPVGGGASWRMIVDFGNLTESIGVYPGGQSENPMGPHYADQVPLWAQGNYTRLNAVGSPDLLPAAAKTRQISFR